MSSCHFVHLHGLRITVISDGHADMTGGETPSAGHTPHLAGAAGSDVALFLDSSSHSVDSVIFVVAIARTIRSSGLFSRRDPLAPSDAEAAALSHH